MGIIRNLFGIGSSTHEKISLKDKDLGNFSALDNAGNRIVWKGSADFLAEKISLFIHGEKAKLDDSQKKSVIMFLASQQKMEHEINQALRQEYDLGGKQLSNWRNHFKCISISASENDLNVAMEEKETFHQFNIRFIADKATGVTVDR